MYYLNDKHPEYEYALYCRVGSATPYIVPRKFNDMSDVLRFIDELEKRHNRYHQIFFIDNDFYENKYSINHNGTYYKFLRRKVFDWEEFIADEGTINRVKIIQLYKG